MKKIEGYINLDYKNKQKKMILSIANLTISTKNRRLYKEAIGIAVSNKKFFTRK